MILLVSIQSNERSPRAKRGHVSGRPFAELRPEVFLSSRVSEKVLSHLQIQEEAGRVQWGARTPTALQKLTAVSPGVCQPTSPLTAPVFNQHRLAGTRGLRSEKAARKVGFVRTGQAKLGTCCTSASGSHVCEGALSRTAGDMGAGVAPSGPAQLPVIP